MPDPGLEETMVQQVKGPALVSCTLTHFQKLLMYLCVILAPGFMVHAQIHPAPALATPAHSAGTLQVSTVTTLMNPGFEAGAVNWVLKGSGGAASVQSNAANAHS